MGETYRADAITWMNGLKEFGDFEIVTWELNQNNLGLNRIKRIFELRQHKIPMYELFLCKNTF